MNDTKPKGQIYMGGELVFGGPDIAARLKTGEKIYFNNDQEVEASLSVEARLRDQIIEAAPWFHLAYAELEITTPCFQFEDGTLEIVFKGGGNVSLGVVINISQALELRDILNHFIAGCDAVDMLGRKRHVNVTLFDDESDKVKDSPSAS
ncbi:MAG TPA: hypothetical protein PL086_12260 [Candidatus Aminicenantes bacterium]|mgnify:CR=1 FL=1|nr:MAG: hypothetical protein BWX98_01361 [Candidatus Aminicenantes bacterium ADurb.Bin147]HPH45212.1 hypothetical protein [Candidatus Aminicenantes bacterium]